MPHRLHTIPRINLIAGILYNNEDALDKARKALVRIFGKLDFESKGLDFVHTDYYEEEFGSNLKRKFFSFERPCRPDDIYKVKIRASALERALAERGRRTVNIDPGYLDLSKLILFSTKDYSHRIYSGKGIFSEVTLFYKDKRFNPWPWTYPDYRSAEYLEIFDSIREIYKKKDRIC